jgi:RHS repeat-associated protein
MHLAISMMQRDACSSSVAFRNSYKFTGKERDAESGLDYFGARYYGSSLGRFMQTDPKPGSAHMLNPQSWNRYAYTLNNPLKFIDPNGMDVVLAAGLSQSDRSYVVNNLARMYATPAGKGFLQRADQSKFTITVGTGHLGRTDLTKAPPGAVVFGGQTKVEGGNTRYGTVTSDGHTQLVAKSPDSPTAPAIQVIIDKDQSAEIGKDPAKVFGHELGGHTADVLDAAEGNANQFIDSVNPKDETSSEAAEKAMGKVPNQPSQEDVQAVEEILKPREEPKKEEKPQ